MKNLKYILVFIPFLLNSQNLIPNGDFEMGPDTTSWGWSLGMDTSCFQFEGTPGPEFWEVTNNSPDRIFTVYGETMCGWDRDSAQSGNAYIVLGGGQLFESGKAILLSHVKQDSLYHLSYFVKLETFSNATSLPNRIAFKFGNNDTIKSNLVIDTIWEYRDTIFKASFEADEVEILGIGLNDEFAVDLDNIKIEKISLNSFIQEKKILNNFNVFPNPALDKIIIINDFTKNVLIKIVDVFGNTFIETNIRSPEEIINTSILPSGIYFVLIFEENKILKNQILITNK